MFSQFGKKWGHDIGDHSAECAPQFPMWMLVRNSWNWLELPYFLKFFFGQVTGIFGVGLSCFSCFMNYESRDFFHSLSVRILSVAAPAVFFSAGTSNSLSRTTVGPQKRNFGALL
jgi:hypothetical protein